MGTGGEEGKATRKGEDREEGGRGWREGEGRVTGLSEGAGEED